MENLVMRDIVNAYRGKSVLITGDTGFKGSWLALLLHDAGAEVTGFSLPPKGESPHYTLLGLDRLIRHVDGDVRDSAAVERVFREARPEVVFHLAAQALVRESYADPKTTFDTNIGGGVNILDAARRTEALKALVFITSDKCYRNNEWTWGYRENDTLGGSDPYSASKAAVELVFASYVDSFFAKRGDTGIVTARAGNVIGGGDWARDRIVPDCVRALLADRPIVLRNPHATRPWQHVLEPLSGYLTLGAQLLNGGQGISGQSWNFGPPVATSAHDVGTLARAIASAWGGGEVIVEGDDQGLHEHGLLHLNTDKAQMHLGWRSRWNFSQTVTETVKWYKAVGLEKKAALDATRQQIADYMGGVS